MAYAGQHFIHKLRVIPEPRGKLAVIEGKSDVPFLIKRTYFLYDVPAAASRGGHAHRELNQLMIAISGSFIIDVESKSGKHSYLLNQPDSALFIGTWVWREMREFSSNAVCLVLASEVYDEADYIRNYDDFSLEIKGLA